MHSERFPHRRRAQLLPTGRLVALALAAGLATAGCRTAPIYDVTEAAVPTIAGEPSSAERVREAIVRASARLGWGIRSVGPGALEGTLGVRDHVAVVDIAYTPASFSIHYKSSLNLGESGGTIHSNYNGWVRNLQREINAELALPRGD
jgi:hypothetical protein